MTTESEISQKSHVIMLIKAFLGFRINFFFLGFFFSFIFVQSWNEMSTIICIFRKTTGEFQDRVWQTVLYWKGGFLDVFWV